MLAPCPSQHADRPFHGLWSLWDMLEIDAENFVTAVGGLGALDALLTKLPQVDLDAKPSASRMKFVALLERFLPACEALGARVTHLAGSELCSALREGTITGGELAEEVRQIRKTFKRELQAAKLFAMNPDDAKFYDGAIELFGDDVLCAFPLASSEIDEAGKCIALGRAPSAVFHLMRIAELGLRALAQPLGIMDPNPDWGAVIRKIDAELKAPKDKRTLNIDYGFLAGVSSHMHAVKLAWRNQAMHVDATFSLDNAREIFNAMKALMQHLASGLSRAAAPP